MSIFMTTLPALLKGVLSLMRASQGRLGTMACRLIADSWPKLSTIMKTVSKPSSSLT
uniref:Uncharacterized protein n=1 Tax=Zosterops lateralis melanops TaxID=1220523 RepID=A0A8D2PM86_ZOSLA